MLKKIINRVKDTLSSPPAPAATKRAKAAPKSEAKPKRPAPAPEVWVPGEAENKTTAESSTTKKPNPRRQRTPQKSASEPTDPRPSRPQRRRRRPTERPDAASDNNPPPDAVDTAPVKSQPSAGGNAPTSEDGSPPRRRRRRSRGGRGRNRNRSAESGEVKPDTDTPQTDGATAPATKPAAPKSPAPTLSSPKPKNINSFEGQLSFDDMDIAEPIKRALADMHFSVTTPIQARLLPVALAGRDAAGKAQTGTGKTAAFLIAIFNHFLKNPIEGERPHGTPRALILAPTRELALQINQDAVDIGRHSGLHTVAVYGGMDYNKQQQELEQPVDIIVATPGRLLDFAQRKVVHLKKVETLVIDEADRMLDMGFIPDVRKIVRMTPHPEQRQTLLFSATLTPNIVRLAEQWTRKAETVEIEPERIAAESVNQRVFITTQEEKFTLLLNLLWQEEPDRVLIFSNRRDQADMLCDHLKSYGFETALLSGAVDQKKRVRVLDDFKAGKVRVLVATDVAGRGLHVEGISHVINYHMPMDPDDYVHRIGRTGRAGESGTSISFACELDSFAIPDVEAFIGHPLPCEHPAEDLLKPLPPPQYKVVRKPRSEGPRRTGGRPSGGGNGRRPRRR